MFLSISQNFEIFGFSIAWYAIIILTGIILAAFIGIREGVRLGIQRNDILDGLLYCMPLAILGTRLYYVIFNFDRFGFDILYMLGWDRQNGRFALEGLAVHGGIITAAIFVFFYCKRRSIDRWRALDILAPSLLVGQIIGRWGNFINQEAHGPATSRAVLARFMPNWMVEQMRIGGIYYHPTFLYESVWNLIGLVIIVILRRTKLIKLGDIFPLYLIWYGLGRGLLIEPFRTDPLMLFGVIRVNVMISLLFCAIGIAILVLKRKGWPDPKYFPEQMLYIEALEEKEDGRKHAYI